ncbi:EthD family reductase [Variovorax sp. LT1R16]|uniref:EthD domain-containing protein n=1 Tax=Variovorax sp. LT1R16 TaxID=3443728 RepID=UPI003F454A91
MGLIKKRADWTGDDFRAYWRERHGALAAQAPNLRGYWQNAVTDRLQRGIDFTRGPWEFDGFSQLWFDDAAQANQAFGQSAIAADLIKDEAHFLDGLHVVTAEQRVVIPAPAAAERQKLLKRMSTLKRREDVSEDDFRREWIVHGERVKRMPGVSAYRQNVIIGREAKKGTECTYDELPIDGIVELWFESSEALGAAFASRAGQQTMAHARTFLSEITAFVVEEHCIK